jgi:uncharacterized membrane protein YhdT
MKTNLFVDLGIFAAFLIAFEPGFTGVPIHEWLSMALAATSIVHILLHWRWIVTLTVTFFRKMLHSSRLDYVVDALLFAAFTAVMLSGLLISESVLPFFGLHAVRQPVWRVLHTASANLTLLLVGLHFALHWNWTVNAFGRILIRPVRRLFGKHPLQPAGTAIKQDER